MDSFTASNEPLLVLVVRPVFRVNDIRVSSRHQVAKLPQKQYDSPISRPRSTEGGICDRYADKNYLSTYFGHRNIFSLKKSETFLHLEISILKTKYGLKKTLFLFNFTYIGTCLLSPTFVTRFRSCHWRSTARHPMDPAPDARKIALVWSEALGD